MDKSGIKGGRIGYIDLYKGIGILLMVIGHSGFGDKYLIFSHGFHMQMFFFASGFLYSKKTPEQLSFGGFLLKKAKSLLIPYVVLGFPQYLFSCIFQGFKLEPLYHLFFMNNTGVPVCNAVWFLTALFFAEVIFFLLDRYLKSEVLKGIIIFVIALLGNFEKVILNGGRLPLSIGAGFVGLGFYYVGYLIRKHKETKFTEKVLSIPWYFNILLALITTVLIFVNGQVNIRESEFSFIPLFWINGILGSIVLLNFARSFYKIAENTIAVKWLVGISEVSVVYVMLNQFCIKLFFMVFKYLPMKLPIMISHPAALVCTLVFLFAAGKLFSKTKLRVLIGRF